jgi:hypothetical protein
MAEFGKRVDRREFGRRVTCLRAHILVPGRPRLACIVRDISVGGALLELDIPSWLPFSFDLVIEASRFQTACEIRHQRANAVGVRFITATAVTSPGQGRPALSADELTTWMGPR